MTTTRARAERTKRKIIQHTFLRLVGRAAASLRYMHTTATATATATATRVGVFWWEGRLCHKKKHRLHNIIEYFNETRLRDVLLPVLSKKGTLSLRALDWLVTNYSKKKPVVYNVTPPNCPEVVVNMYRSYKTWLWNHKRKNFDPFRRGQRIFFTVDDKTYESTVGQLNFFFWASRYGVLDYAQRHIRDIEKDQALSTRHQHGAAAEEKTTDADVDAVASSSSSSAPMKRKRRQLSQAPRQTVFVYPTHIKVVFNPELKQLVKSEQTSTKLDN